LNPTYYTLRKSHENFERIFRHWRDRFGVAGKNADTRLERPGVPCQELWTSAALVIEWFRPNYSGLDRILPIGVSE